MTTRGLKCYLIFTKSKEKFVEQAQRIFGKYYNYDLVEYKNNYTNIIVICPFHGKFKVTPSNHLSRKSGCPTCRCKGKFLV